MAELSFYINNVLSPPPLDWQGIEIEVSWENNSPDATIKTTNFQWLGEDANTLYTWFKNGLTTGLGIYEGIPLRIEGCDGVVLFDGCIDMTSEETTFQCDIVKASCIETQRVQFLTDRTDGFSFAYLRSLPSFGTGSYTTTLTNADYIAIPYVISTIPDWLQVAILVVSFIEMVKLIRDSILTINGYILAGVSAAPIVWQVAMYAALALAAIIYAIFLMILAINVLLMMINEIIQPIKFKYGMKVKTLFEKGCAYLNLNFSSTILQGAYKNAVIIPRKNAYFTNLESPDAYLSAIFSGLSTQRKVYNEVANPNAYGYYEGTFGQLIREMEDVFNAKVVVRNNTLYFERWDYWNNNSTFVMPNQSSEAPFEDPYGTNASELSSNYMVEWTLDSVDENTLDQYDGMSTQMTLKPIIINNQRNILLKGLTEKVLPYSLAKRKVKLSVPEQIVNKIINFITPFYNTLASLTHSAPPMVANLTNNRVGAMLLSSDFTGVQKFVIVESQPRNWNGVMAYNIDVNNTNAITHLGLTDAYYLSKNYHSASWAIDTTNGTTTYPNQYLTFKDKEIPLCCSDFKILKDSNIIKSYDLKPGRLLSLRWNPFNETAKVDFKIKEVFTKNLGQKIIIDGKQ